MRLIPGFLLTVAYLVTSDGHPNGLMILAIITIAVGAFLELRHSGKVIDRIIVETLHDAADPKIMGQGSFDVDAHGRISNLNVDGITVDDEGNITDASPEAMAILFEILDLVQPPKDER